MLGPSAQRPSCIFKVSGRNKGVLLSKGYHGIQTARKFLRAAASPVVEKLLAYRMHVASLRVKICASSTSQHIFGGMVYGAGQSGVYWGC